LSINLFLCTSNEIAKIPYTFKITNIKVYSFEEAVYHTYHYWKQSIDDFDSDEFITWIYEELNLYHVYKKVKEIKKIGHFNDRIIKFLTLTDYLNDNEIEAIAIDIKKWNKRLEWEKLKERADYLITNNEYRSAIEVYKKALGYGENTSILNNIGVSFMYIEDYKQAEMYFKKALTLASENNNMEIIYNLAEANIHNLNFKSADKLIEILKIKGEYNDFLSYLCGELEFKKGNIRESIVHYQEAYNIEKDLFYLYCLCEVYMNLRQFSKATHLLESVDLKDKNVYIRLSEVYRAAGDKVSAIKCIKEAIKNYDADCSLMLVLARYYREDYNLKESLEAITIAIKFDPIDKNAKLELAKIKKAMGSIKDYQQILKDILKEMKDEYIQIQN
jgi:tetratricopeptide (TPR) repeat protein